MLLQTRAMVEAQHSGAQNTPSIHASGSSLYPTKFSKIPKTDSNKNQKTTSYKSPDQDEIRSSQQIPKQSCLI